MAYESVARMFADQIISIAWIRCVQEEGVDFVNKETGEVEKDERVIYESFENQTGLFDLPAAKGSRWGLEKNILEVYGSYCLYNDDPNVLSLLTSSDLKQLITEKIQSLQEPR